MFGKYKPNRLTGCVCQAQCHFTDIARSRPCARQHRSIPAARLHVQACGRGSSVQRLVDCHEYNCMGCHQVDIGQRSVLMDLADVSERKQDNLPPVLTSEGARVYPEWLKGFLANPAQSTTDHNRTECAATCRCVCRRSRSPTMKYARW